MADAVRVKYSNSHKAKMARIKRLPKLIKDSADAILKKDAIGIIKEFQNGIRRNNFGLTGLSDYTVQRKAEQGMSKPRSPLYGSGDSKKNSLINTLAIRKIKNGYRIYRRRAKHHSADLPLSALLSIHENGAVILVTPKMRAYLHFIGLHLKETTKMIRIPPRPVVDKAIQRHLRKKVREEGAKEVKRAIRKLLKTGSDSIFKKIMSFDDRLAKEVKD